MDRVSGVLPNSLKPERLKEIREEVARYPDVYETSRELLSHIDSLTRERDEAYERAAKVALTCPDSHWGPWCAAGIRALIASHTPEQADSNSQQPGDKA